MRPGGGFAAAQGLVAACSACRHEDGVTELADIEPIHVAAYIEWLQTTAATAHRRGRVHTKAWLPHLPCDGHYRLSRGRRFARERAGDGGT